MWTLPCSKPEKAGIILYGLVVGASMVPLTALGRLLIGVCVGAIEHLLGVHGAGAWLLVGSLLYGFYLGIPVGLAVAYKVCRSRLREIKSEGSN